MRGLAVLLLGASITAQAPEARGRAELIPPASAFVGQSIELRLTLSTEHGFRGVPRFEIPEIPGVVVAKLGNPVVGSERVDGETWSTQIHAFALVARQAGDLVVPEFPVRLQVTAVDRRRTFDTEVGIASCRIPVVTPPGAEGVEGLVCARRFLLEVTWDRDPRAATVGDAFTRTVRLRADGVLGMTLPPLPSVEHELLGVYPAPPVVTDESERGAFAGERIEKLTIVCARPGRVDLPGVAIRWFDLERGTLETERVPAVGFDVAPAAPRPEMVAEAAGAAPWVPVGLVLAVAGILVGARRRIRVAFDGWRARRAATESAYLRRAVAACRTNDARAAHAAILAWLGRRDPRPRAPLLADLEVLAPAAAPEVDALELAVVERRAWNGDALARCLRSFAAIRDSEAGSPLLPLNPPGV
jgi:hypothetical protein